MPQNEKNSVRLCISDRPYAFIGYAGHAVFLSLLGIGALIFGLQELYVTVFRPNESAGIQWALWITAFVMCAFVVFSKICILEQVMIENGAIYEYRKFAQGPKKLFSLAELKSVTARKYSDKNYPFFNIMSLDLRFRDVNQDRNEWIIELPISTSPEEASAFAKTINHFISEIH